VSLSMTLRIWGVQECSSSMIILTLKSKTKLFRSSFTLKMRSKLRQLQTSLKSLALLTKVLQIKTSASIRFSNQGRTWRYQTSHSDKLLLKPLIQTLKRHWTWLSNQQRTFNYTTSNQRS
jgi:hypothetical protein